MTSLPMIAVWLACAAPLAAAPSAPTAGDAAKVVQKIVAAFETGTPVEAAVTKDELLVLETAPVAARGQADLHRRIPETLKRVGAFQGARTPAVPACPAIAAPDKDPNGCVMAAARAAAKDLGIVDGARQEAAASLYLALYLGPKDGTPAELAAAQRRAETAMSDPRVSQRSAERMRRVMAQGGSFTVPGDPGAVGSSNPALPAGGGRRTPEQAVREAQGTRRAPVTKVAPVDVPLGDDGTTGAAIALSARKIGETGSALAGYFGSADTWKRTARGAWQMVSNPLETAQYLPGAIKAGALALVEGAKADIDNASGEVGRFIENPTPYRFVAAGGSTLLAVSNAFIVGGGAKTAVRRGAMAEIEVAAKDATQTVARGGARDGGIGAAETAVAAGKPVVDPAARAIYKRTIGQADEVPFMMDQGIIEVAERIPTSAKQQIMYKQTGPTCVFGAVCNLYQGTAGVTPSDVLSAIRRENPAYSNTMAKSNIDVASMERISSGLATKAGRTPVAISSTGDFVTHMRSSGQPVLVAVQTGSGRHAIVLSEAMVTKEGKVYFRTLDTNISVRPGAEAARGEKFGIITAEDLDKILASKGFSHS